MPNPDADRLRESLDHARREIAEKRLKLLEDAIERGADDPSALIDDYKMNGSTTAVLDLFQDLNRKLYIYNNLLEELKRIGAERFVDVSGHRLDPDVHDIRIKYEQLGLVDEGFLPNPSARALADRALEKLNKFAMLLVRTVNNYSVDLLRELRLQPGQP